MEHRAMVARAPALVVVVVAVVFSATLTSVPAVADNGETCAFELSPPRLVTLPGGPTVVTTSLEATHCTGTAQPESSAVCLTPDGGGGQCASTDGWGMAQVLFAPTDPVTGYTATGSGLVRTGRYVNSVVTGPIRATL